MEKESFNRLESMNCELEDLKEMIGLMYDECFIFRMDSLNEYEIRDKFRTAQIMTNSIFSLLYYQVKENREFIDKVYEERKVEKEGVA